MKTLLTDASTPPCPRLRQAPLRGFEGTAAARAWTSPGRKKSRLGLSRLRFFFSFYRFFRWFSCCFGAVFLSFCLFFGVFVGSSLVFLLFFLWSLCVFLVVFCVCFFGVCWWFLLCVVLIFVVFSCAGLFCGFCDMCVFVCLCLLLWWFRLCVCFFVSCGVLLHSKQSRLAGFAPGANRP